MNVAPRPGYDISLSFVFFFFTLFIMAAAPAEAQNSSVEQAPLFTLLSPEQNHTIIAKKPLIKIAFARPMDLKSLLVMLDGVDITQVLFITPDGCTYRPIQVLEPGTHTLMITGATAQGESLRHEFSFSTRHHKSYEKAFSEHKLTILAQRTLSKSDSLEEQVPDSRTEAGLNSTSQLQDDGWDVTFNTDLKYIHQDIPVFMPEKEGLDLINYLLTANYARGGATTHAEIGDTQIDLSQNTLSYLSRRGAQLFLETKRVKIGGFSINSAQTYGYDGESGIGSDSGTHIHGAYGDLNLLDNRMRLRAIYTAGGEQGDSFGTSDTDRSVESNTAGLVLSTDFFEGRLVSEFESNFSKFDADTTDNQASRSDAAYRLNLQGALDRYTYSATYKYYGSNYEVVGNQGLEKDRQGIELNGGAGFDNHGLSLSYAHFRDNVDGDSTQPVIQTGSAMLDYSYNGIQRLPISLSYQVEKSESSREPAGTEPVEYQIDSVSSSITYLYNQWYVALQGTVGQVNDMTANDADSTNTLIALMPQYFTEFVSISPNLSYNQTRDHTSGINTDAYTISMEAQGRLPNGKFAYGFGATMDYTTTSDDTLDQKTTAYHINLDYLPGRFFRGRITPAIGLRGESNTVKDYISGEKTQDFAFMLTLTVSTLTSF